MTTALQIGPADHGRPLAYDEFIAADVQDGFHYELIQGKLYVAPQANLPENWIEEWLGDLLKEYARTHPRVINYVTHKAHVFVPDQPATTCPEPDIAAYHDFPTHLPLRRLRWQNVSPILVAEVLSRDDPDKDLVRNLELYLQVPSIREYWILDARADPERPTMRVRRRYRGRWKILDIAPGDTYATHLLPGWELIVDPRR
ncbi:MAG: Uma2 family endonuclease [Gemmataceae bacterium]